MYQQYMNNVLFNYFNNFCTAYLDNIIIYFKNELEHKEHVYKVLQQFCKTGLQADIKKSEFSVKRTKYLGFIISTNGIETDLEKTVTINQWTPPQTVKGVQLFLSFCNFYWCFIKDYSRIAWLFNCLTRKDQPFNFNTVCKKAFNELKEWLILVSVFVHFHSEWPLMLETNASDGAIASVFPQKQLDREWHPIAYYLKTMIDAELNYPIYDKEMLAIIFSFQHWHIQLEGTFESI